MKPFKYSIIASLIILFSANNIALAQNSEDFSSWLSKFKQKAVSKGISRDTVESTLKGIQFKEKVVKLDKKQPEKTITFADYKRKVIPQSRINRARRKLKENYAILDQIEKQFGVQKRFIVALWAVESNFGDNMGGYYIPQALATLAYEGRRREFFEKELLNSLQIIDAGHVRKDNFLGSWAGAMGQCQFMPSSFLAYAYDFNKDGRKDIWGTKADVFASVANYLKNTGWKDDYTWGRQVIIPTGLRDELISNKVSKPISFWKSVGVLKADGSALLDTDIQASLIDPDGDDGKRGEVYLVYKNFKNIMKWNRSLFFATSVGLLSDKLR